MGQTGSMDSNDLTPEQAAKIRDVLYPQYALHGAEIERLEAEQDRIEFELGLDIRPGSKRWSGAP
jgi:Spy/CpxP family protein refolding chaperone